MHLYHDLKNRVALVTGASSGIGSAAALVLAASGAKVAVNYLNNERGAADTIAAITNSGGMAFSAKADVSSVIGCKALVDTVEQRFGPVEILVNNAGTMVRRMKILEITEESWDQTLDVNLKSACFCTQAVVSSMMRQKRGVIVNNVSIAGRSGGSPGASHYAAAKGGLIAFSKNMAKELAPHGIRVNAVSPGVIDTPFHEQFSTPEMMKSFVAMIPMGRVGTSGEIAAVIAFLCSDASSYVCGETIEVNGGQLML